MPNGRATVRAFGGFCDIARTFSELFRQKGADGLFRNFFDKKAFFRKGGFQCHRQGGRCPGGTTPIDHSPIREITWHSGKEYGAGAWRSRFEINGSGQARPDRGRAVHSFQARERAGVVVGTTDRGRAAAPRKARVLPGYKGKFNLHFVTHFNVSRQMPLDGHRRLLFFKGWILPRGI